MHPCQGLTTMRTRRMFLGLAVAAGLAIYVIIYTHSYRLPELLWRRTATTSVPPNIMDPRFCLVNCTAGSPCEYLDELDLRIISIVFDRSQSLARSLRSVSLLDTMGDRVAVDIWIDRSVDGVIDPMTYQVAVNFSRAWRKGRVCIHNQTSNAYIGGQWIDTWKPKEGTREIALILEDDIDISPYSYRWLKQVHRQYGQHRNVSGYTLQMENVLFYDMQNRNPIEAPATDSVYMVSDIGTWGFSPHPMWWRRFQQWYHDIRKDPNFKPYVDGLQPTQWYQEFEAAGTQESMWEMWWIYFLSWQKLYCVHSNLIPFTRWRGDVLLATNRQERGLHFSTEERQDKSEQLLKDGNLTAVKFPVRPIYYWFDGTQR